MKFFVVVVCCILLQWNVCSARGTMVNLAAVGQSNWKFSSALYSAMAKDGKASENLIFSPLSVQVILAMCYTGAGSTTAQQISKGLHLPNKPDVVKSGFHQLLKSLTTSGDVTLEMANKMFPDVSFTLRKDFIENVNKNFLSDIENVDYKKAWKTANTINGWVKEKTHGKISNIVSKSKLEPSTLMVLINAVYFKGDWQNAFNKKLTTKDVFYDGKKVNKTVDMMHSKRSLFYWKNSQLGATMVELPYKDNSTSLVIILPDKVDGLSRVEANLEKMSLQEVLKSGRTFKQKKVILSLPRFKLELNKQLDKNLKGLGMSKMFSYVADFSSISPSRGLFVSQVMHKAMIEVNEEGTEAAAATSAQYGLRSMTGVMSSPDIEYVVDHPFVFVLVSRRAGVVLFMGRYTDVPAPASTRLARAGQVTVPVQGRGKDVEKKKSASSGASVFAVCSYVWILTCGFLGF